MAQTPSPQAPEWALSKRERANRARQQEGLPPLPKRRWPWVVVVLLLAGGGGWYATQGTPVASAPLASETLASAPLRMEINAQEYTTARVAPVDRTLRITGTIHPRESVDVSGPVGGRVQEVSVRVGDRVEEGAVVMRLDPEPLERARGAQAATVAATEAQLTLARSQRDRTRALVGRGGSTQAQLDQAEGEVSALEAQLDGQRESLAAATLDVENAALRAPIAGVVVAREANPGSTIAAGAPVVRIADLSAVDFEASVPLAQAARLATGQQVRVQADGADGTFTGVLERINPVADAQARATSVFIRIPNPDGALLGGMYAVGQITIDSQDGVLIPEDGVREDDQGSYVLVVRDGVLERAAVEITPDWTERHSLIREGVKDGEVIITAALPELRAGDPVVLVE